MKVSATLYISRSGIDDIEVLVTGTYSPGQRGVRANKWDRFAPPDDPAEVEIESAVVQASVYIERDIIPIFNAGERIELGRDEEKEAEEKLFEAAEEQAQSAREQVRAGLHDMEGRE